MSDELAPLGSRDLDEPGPGLDPPSWLQRLLGFRPQPLPSRASVEDAWTNSGKTPDSEGVTELLRIAEAVVEDERERGRQLDSKAANLVGFGGVILAVDTALAKTIFHTEIGAVGTPIGRAAFFISVLALLYSTSLAVGGVLMPQKYRGLGRDQLRDFGGPDAQAMTRVQVCQSMVGALEVILHQDRPLNDFKARLIKRVAVGLLVGFAALAAEGITLGIHQVFSG